MFMKPRTPLFPWLTVLLTGLAINAKAVEGANDTGLEERPINATEREFWSFRDLVRPAIPTILNSKLTRNEIDQFVQAKLEAEGRTLAGPASPETLLRRVTFDLTGLPPTPEEVHQFQIACDASAKAVPGSQPDPYLSVVNRLLDSPRYGEKWAQGWLDLARFAETDGFEKDGERKQAWKYRDWVVKALNEDRPFNEFVALQIAGDEMAPEQAAATGFLLAGPDMVDSNFQDERRHLLLNDITTTVGSAFLGLTVGCAQCHNHPFDPVSQADFYKLRAFFENLIPLKKDVQIPAVMKEPGPNAPVSRIAIRGDFARPGDPVVPTFPRVAAAPEDGAPAQSVLPNSSGRRSGLARWLTRSNNRLFVRSSVNRLWQGHFGEAIASTPSDLGHQGSPPSNPALLDWLACELPAQHWSLKAMHRLIVTSATYRQAGGNEAQDDERFSSYPRRRLTGEELRDALLMVAGRLEYREGGTSERLPEPTRGKAAVAEPDCRSIWLFARRNERHPLLDLYDRPDALLSCSRRNISTNAPQALTLFNSEFSREIATALATLLMKTDPTLTALIRNAYLRCFARLPTSVEQVLGEHFLSQHPAFTTSEQDTVADYCLALINSNAFCYVD